LKLPQKWVYYLYSIAAVAAVTIIGDPIHKFVESTNIVMLYLAVVMVSAIFWGRGPAMLASVVSVLAFDFFLVSPRLSFSVNDTQYLITFVGLFAVGLLVSNLAATIRTQVIELKERESINAALFALSRSLSEAKGKTGVLDAIAFQIRNSSQIFSAPLKPILLFVEIFWIEFLGALRTDAGSEIGFRMFSNIDFNPVPITLIIADFFA
jgi:two-component system sensor histidine kinase KdpD